MTTPLTPDTKDWTWVIHRRCPECGFDGSAIPRESTGRVLTENAATWQALLADDDGDGGQVHRRPDPQVWSTLEYGCHVRDVCRLFDQRLELMLTQDDPRFANWDQDETAVADRYHEQEPAAVAAELAAAAATLAARFDGVSGDQWQRTGSRSNGSEFTVETFARYFLHDVVHHVWDVSHG